MGWRVTSGLWDRLAQRREAAVRVPILSLDCAAAALLVRLDAASLKILLGLAASILHYSQFKEYRQLRPQVTGLISHVFWHAIICNSCTAHDLSLGVRLGEKFVTVTACTTVLVKARTCQSFAWIC